MSIATDGKTSDQAMRLFDHTGTLALTHNVEPQDPPGLPGSINYVGHPQAIEQFARLHLGGDWHLRGHYRERGLLSMLADGIILNALEAEGFTEADL